jgi:uroporphyrinogen decarboxylase
MRPRENWLRAVEYRYPEWIPCTVNLSPLAWKTHRRELEKLVLAHPRIFPGYREGTVRFDRMPLGFRAGEYIIDKWGCGRLSIEEGIAGQVIDYPLADWKALATFNAPDPTAGALDPITQGLSAMMQGRDGPPTWEEVEPSFRERRANGELVKGDGEKLLDRLYFLRGFENLMMDFAHEPPELSRLFAILQEYELKLIDKWMQIGVDAIGFHTDFATQRGLMMSPRSFRKYLKPLFAALFLPCRRAGVHVALSSDGRLLDIVDDLLECGVSVHDPQLRANTVEGIARVYKGRLCASVDLDQQGFPFMSPAQIREQIREVVGEVASPEGGLMLSAGINDAIVSLRNIEAIVAGMEEFCFP